jgi:hypothetical protein
MSSHSRSLWRMGKHDFGAAIHQLLKVVVVVLCRWPGWPICGGDLFVVTLGWWFLQRLSGCSLRSLFLSLGSPTSHGSFPCRKLSLLHPPRHVAMSRSCACHRYPCRWEPADRSRSALPQPSPPGCGGFGTSPLTLIRPARG